MPLKFSSGQGWIQTNFKTQVLPIDNDIQEEEYFIWPKEAVDRVNKLIDEGYLFKKACEIVSKTLKREN